MVSGGITWVFGLYLILLFLLSVYYKKRAIRYFSAFASSARAHYLEQTLRMIAGIGVLLYSGQMLYSTLFKWLGYLLIGVSVLLYLTPWKWHNKFGEWAIPWTIKFIYVYAIGACVLGSFIIYCIIKPLI